MVARFPFVAGAFVRSSATSSSSTKNPSAIFWIARLNSRSSGESVSNTVISGSGPGSMRSSGSRTSSRRSPLSCGLIANEMTGCELNADQVEVATRRQREDRRKQDAQLTSRRGTRRRSCAMTPSAAFSSVVEVELDGRAELPRVQRPRSHASRRAAAALPVVQRACGGPPANMRVERLQSRLVQRRDVMTARPWPSATTCSTTVLAMHALHGQTNAASAAQDEAGQTSLHARSIVLRHEPGTGAGRHRRRHGAVLRRRVAIGVPALVPFLNVVPAFPFMIAVAAPRPRRRGGLADADLGRRAGRVRNGALVSRHGGRRPAVPARRELPAGDVRVSCGRDMGPRETSARVRSPAPRARGGLLRARDRDRVSRWPCRSARC